MKNLWAAAAGLTWACAACLAFAQSPIPAFDLGPLHEYRPTEPVDGGSVAVDFTGIAIGDVTGDGRADLVGHGRGNQPEVLIYAQGSDGALRAPLKLPTLSDLRYPDLELIDLNEDGVRDIVVGTGNMGVDVFISDAKGGFLAKPYPLPYLFNSISAVDVDGDRHWDLVGSKLGNDGWHLAVIYGDGKGGFSRHVEFSTGTSASESPTKTGVSAADVNGDGFPDLVFMTTFFNFSTMTTNGTVRIRYHDGAGGFLAPVTLAYTENRDGFAIGDFNRDGRADIATTTISEPRAWFFYQGADGNFVQSPPITTYTMNPSPVFSFDLNQDHRDDLLTLHTGWKTLGFFAQGANGIQAADARGMAIPYSDFYRDSLAVGDLNGDHCNDIAIAGTYNGFGVAYGRGCEKPSPTTDVNGDRKSDLAWRKPGSLAYWLMNGASPTSTQVAGSAGTGFKLVAAGDYNGDGFLDFAWSNGEQLKFWLNNKRGGFTSSAVTYYGASWQPFASADLDADGKDDLLWRQGSHVAHWLMDGSRVRSSGYTGDGGTGFKVVATGDFDGDGTADLALASSTTLKLWINRGAARFRVEPAVAFGGGWSPFAAGDIDADGKSDLLWRSASGSALAFWLMDGARVRLSGYSGDAGAGFSLVASGDYNGDRAADLVFANGSQMKIWTNSGSGRFSSITRPYSGGWQPFDPRIPVY